MFGSKKNRAREQAEKAVEDAKRGLALNSKEGRKIAYDALIQALQLFETQKITSHNAKLFMYLGDIYLQSGEGDTALNAYGDAVSSPNGLGDPEIHLRIGKLLFDRGEEKKASDELARALIMGGKKVFDGENKKYFEFITGVLDPPPGGWDDYEPPAK